MAEPGWSDIRARRGSASAIERRGIASSAGPLQGVWLMRQGRSGREVARVMGYGERWVAEIVRSYNEDGLEGLADQRHGNAGAKPLLDAAQRAALGEALQGAPPEGDL